MSIQSPLARAQGRGSAKSGVDHWWSQRVSAVALVPLTLWFLWSLANVEFGHFSVARDWFGNLKNAALTILLIVSLGYHAHLGVMVVVEDYVRGAAKIVGLIFVQFTLAAAVAIAVLAILKIAFGG